MISNINNTTAYKLLNLNKNSSQAYLFYSIDKALNNEIALAKAQSIVCDSHSNCGNCANCVQFNKNSHPDVYILNQESIKVEDITKLMDKFATKPVYSNKKVFVILNADTMNEIVQNKLLKSFEEPNESNIFILSTSKLDKILPTILSRLTKLYVPKLNLNDKLLIKNELLKQKIDISKFIEMKTLTEILNFSTNESFISTAKAISDMFSNLSSTSDIPNVVSNLGNVNKQEFFQIMQEMFLSCLKPHLNSKFDESITAPIKLKFNTKVLMKSLDLIEEAYKKQNANVNFNYILDNLLFDILKEKFLCK